MRLAAWALAACRQPDTDTDTVGPDETDVVDIDPTTLGACEGAASQDPLTRGAAVAVDDDPDYAGGVAHVVHFVGDETAGIGFGASYSGVITIDLATLDVLGSWAGGQRTNQVVRMSAGSVLAVADRGRSVVMDVRDPTAPTRRFDLPVEEVVAGTFDGERLFVVDEGGALRVFEPGSGTLVETARVDGFAGARDLTHADGMLYLVTADARLLVIDGPTLQTRTTMPLAGAAQRLAASGEHLAVALGSAGVQVFTIAPSADPIDRGAIDVGGPAVGVHVRDGWVAVADHGALTMLDATDPAQIRSLGRESTVQWGMSPWIASADRVVLAEWDEMVSYQVSREVVAPSLQPSPTELFCPGPESTVRLWNRGGGDLTILGAEWDDVRFSATIDRVTVAPGEAATLAITFADDGAPVDASLCVGTDDPDRPSLEVTLSTGSPSTEVALCAPATDFTLEDLDGVSHTLSAQRGAPVMLAYFATW